MGSIINIIERPVPPAPPAQASAARIPAPRARPVANVIVRKSPTLLPRVYPIDVTGLYEHVPEVDGQNAAVMLQLSQAGKAVVGWFCAPPQFVANLAMTRSRRTDNKWRMPNGVLFGTWDSLSSQGIQITWLKGKFDKINTLDPDDAMLEFEQTPASNRLQAGYLSVKNRRPGELFLEVQIKFDPGADQSDRFIRSSRHARFSALDLGFFPPALARLAEAETVAPVPSTYVDAIRAAVAPVGDPPVDPPVKQHFQAWYAAKSTGSDAEQQIERQAIADTLYHAVFTQAATDEQRAYVARRLRAHMASRLLVLGSTEKSYLEWYRDVLAQEQQAIGLNPANPSSVMPRFKAVGITILGRFRYTVTFDAKGVTAMLIVGAGIYTSRVFIKKEKIEYITDKSGDVVFSDGRPKYNVRSKVSDSREGMRSYECLFGNIGVGLGVEGAAGGSSLLGEMTFLSDEDIEFEDFAGARFSIACFRGPKAAMGNFISFETFTAKIVEMRLVGGATLTSDTTKYLALNGPKAPTLEDLKDPAKYVRKWTSAKLDGKIFDVSEGYGGLGQVVGDSPKVPSVPSVDKPPASFSAAAKRVLEVYFAVNSADLVTSPSSSLPPRDALEVLLATERALFTTVDASSSTWGYASPEDSSEHNLTLSQERADAISQAVRDAFGSGLAIRNLGSTGLGETPAVNNGLHDPEQTKLSLADFEQRYPSEVAQWPAWRRVDLEAAGTVVASAVEVAPGNDAVGE